MRLTKEKILQISTAEFARHHKLPFIHIANERKTSAASGVLLKKMGVRSGVSDCFFPRGNGVYAGLWIELKIKPNKPTENQIKFLSDMLNEGYDAVVCYNLKEVIDVLTLFYSLKI